MSIPTTRRRGVYVLGQDAIARALRLPAGQRVVAVGHDFRLCAILVAAEGGDLPEIPEAGEAPIVNHRWPVLQFSLLVEGLPADEQHTAVLARLDATVLGDAASLTGRRRILDRHAPTHGILRNPGDYSDARCGWCIDGDSSVEWPCDDYRDAAADLVLWQLSDDADEVHPYARPGGADLAAADLALLSDPAGHDVVDAVVFGDRAARELAEPEHTGDTGDPHAGTISEL